MDYEKAIKSVEQIAAALDAVGDKNEFDRAAATRCITLKRALAQSAARRAESEAFIAGIIRQAADALAPGNQKT